MNSNTICNMLRSQNCNSGKMDVLLRVDIKPPALVHFLKTLRRSTFLSDVHLLSSKSVNFKRKNSILKVVFHKPKKIGCIVNPWKKIFNLICSKTTKTHNTSFWSPVNEHLNSRRTRAWQTWNAIFPFFTISECGLFDNANEILCVFVPFVIFE